MSDEKARARRMMRLSELHARANKWREEEKQTNPSKTMP
jgi:hypothetical protein